MRKAFLILLCFVCVLPALGQNKISKKAYKKAKRQYKKSDFVKAVPFLKEALNMDPENALYSYMLGRSYYESDRAYQSLPYLIRAYNFDPNVDPEINYYLSRSLHLNHKFDEAVVHYLADLSRYETENDLYIDTENRIRQCRNAPAVVEREPLKVEITNMGEFVNTEYPEYAATFAEDYSYMIFTSRRPRRIWERIRSLHISEDINEEVYEARLVQGTWMKARLFSNPIPVLKHDASVSVTNDGKTLIYYEDQNYGDIFISRKEEDGKWSKKESIGANINTKYNEPSVFIADDGNTLYYVSDKPDGFGKKDLYVSRKLPNGEWGAGENMGDKFNTPYDEDSPFVSADGKTLYFSSRGHTSIGGYDIFICKMLPDGSWSAPENAGLPLNSAGDDIYYVEEGDGKSFYFTSSRPGGYGEKDIYYGTPSKESYETMPTVVAGNVLDKVSGEPMEADVKLLYANNNKVIGEAKTNKDDGKYSFNIPDCGKEYKLEVTVNTPEGGPSKTGELNIISGKVVDGVSQNPLEAVLDLIDEKSGETVSTTNTNPVTGQYFLPIESGKEYMVRVKANEYLPYYEPFRVDPSEKIEAVNNIYALQKNNEVGKIVISWQFFDVNSAIIKKDYEQDLENITKVLRQVPKSVRIRVTGHTDSDGGTSYNQKLSEQRARAVADYFIKGGIAEDRLIVSGMGESQPIYSNADKKTKRWNRRVELYLIED